MLLILISIFLIALFFLLKKKTNVPGPWGLPVFGYLPWLDPEKPYKTLFNLSKIYGKVYALYMGNIYTVIISDVKIIRKIFANDSTTGRAPLFLTHGLMKGWGLICAEGDLWRNQRKFVVSSMRHLGCTKGPQINEMEKLIIKYVDDFIDDVEDLNGSSFCPQQLLRHYVGSFINAIVFGEFWEKDNKTWLYLQHLQEEGIKHIGIAGPLNFIPILRFLPKYRKTVNFLQDGLQKTHKIYDEIIKEHEKQLEEELEKNGSYKPATFLEAFLLERSKKDTEIADKFYNDTQFKYLLADLFGAALDTTLTTLNWFLIYISLHVNIQTVLREELSKKFKDKTLSYADLLNLPLFEATLTEVQRVRSTVPIGIPHGSVDEFKIEDMTIPPGSMIVPLQWAIHMDENIWENPEKFDPYRHLDGDGRYVKPENFIPFQVGKRICVGEDLAKMILFFFGTQIIKNFEFKISKPDEVDLNGVCGITLTPKEHDITFTKIYNK